MYVLGNKKILNNKGIAIVGTRDCTKYGKNISFKFSKELTQKGFNIISGLAESIIVVEAGERSGAIITANLALEQGKEIFAVPGDITKKQSIGTNKLIKDGAFVITEVNDILNNNV